MLSTSWVSLTLLPTQWTLDVQEFGSSSSRLGHRHVNAWYFALDFSAQFSSHDWGLSSQGIPALATSHLRGDFPPLGLSLWASLKTSTSSVTVWVKCSQPPYVSSPKQPYPEARRNEDQIIVSLSSQGGSSFLRYNFLARWLIQEPC